MFFFLLNMDYIDKDFDFIWLCLILMIKQVFFGWIDFNIVNFGNILMEVMVFVLDVIGKY